MESSTTTPPEGAAGPARAPLFAFLLALATFIAAGVFAYPRLTAPRPADAAAAFLAELGVQGASESAPGGAEAGATATGSAAAAGDRPFTDVTDSLGLDLVHDRGARGENFLPEIIGPGAAFLDFDGDGRLDLFLAGGGAPGSEGGGQSCRLLRNQGDGGAVRFEDVTASAGLDAATGPAFGVACADFDHDGDVDLYVTRIGPNALLLNDGAGHFEDAAAAAGVDHPGFGTSCTFLDFDGDGWLDLYVTNYVDWSPDIEAPCYADQGMRDYCMPLFYEKPSRDVLYRNLGDGRFEDVSEASGISAESGNGLGVIASDFDDDGRVDLYVANDQTPAFLWHNEGGGRFANIAFEAGCAYDGNGVAIAGMGIASEDFDGDGRFDLLVTNIRNQSHLLLENRGGHFVDRSAVRGVGAWSDPATAFGIAVFDQDRDGALDAYVANGDVNLDTSSPHERPYAQPNHFVRFVDGQLVDQSARLGDADPLVSRAVAAGDFDDDGDLDLLVTNNGGPARLLRNDAPGGSWLALEVRLADAAGARHAIGARVRVEADGRLQAREVRPQQGYLASNDPRVFFGLGDARAVERLVVRWPDGTEEEHTDVPLGQHLVLRPGAPLAGAAANAGGGAPSSGR